ncbi:superoxide dismutase [Mesobacillus foraminis]|uniref:superoxide dismutase n=1 Tax=Mesobacillus foraminis TaxID=279826 RepID=A0A4R2B8T9_9BACI|nr:superoxide dismutase [Mesobacillus foraminis]TCN22695.1 Fe-Mn family superoxide dismutase [Mesobacillus foraminis]
MTEQSFRESLGDWCRDLEANWAPIREQLLGDNEEKAIQQWEENFFSLKREAGNEILNDSELYNIAESLYKELNSFFIRADLPTNSPEEEREQTVPIGGHRLPPLPYRYNALEPVISEEIMRLHHRKHHQSYVDGLNKAEKELQKARETGDFGLIKHWEREAAFHGAGHYLHTIFWNIMTPEGGGKPGGELRRSINVAFGSFEKFKKHFSEAAKNVEGVGWAILVWAPRSHRLEILTAEKHQNLTQWDVVPLLVLDVWEHAYYLQYKNERPRYVENWWNIVNWKEVEQRFQAAQKLRWQPF